MWLSIVSLVMLAAADPGAGSNAPPAAAALAPPIATRQNLFAIPFRIDRPDVPAHEPVEVQLYVSGDRGAHWQLYSRVEPARQRFMFRAGVDGEFWFFVRTLDRAGQLRPEVMGAPGLRVVVDTTPPKLQLSAARGEAGQLTARWRIEEANPKPDSLVIQYRIADDAPWQPVALDRQSLTAAGSLQTGEVTWWPQVASGEIQIRAEVSDVAGNPAASNTQVKLGKPDKPEALAGAQPPPKAVEPSTVWRPGSDVPPPANWPADRSVTTLANSRPGGAPAGPQNPVDAGPAGQGSGERKTAESSTARRNTPKGEPAAAAAQPPPARPATAPPAGNAPPIGNAPSTGNPPPAGNAPSPGSAPPIGNAPTAGNAPPIGNGNKVSATPVAAGSVAVNINPAIQNRYLPPDPAAVRDALGLPPGERPRMVNARLFELEYDVESAGPSGITSVELWGTQDGGRTWKSYVATGGNHSPLRVAVDGEGVYGFRVAVKNGAGLGGGPPRPGDLPELWIGVDLSKPTARITSCREGTDADAGKLVIAWEAADNMMLAPRPISLLFSGTPGGPWTTIAAGLENTGRYAWPIDNRLPQRIFLRLEVRDEAGNLGVFEGSDPVTFDRSHPAVHIRNVHPLGGGG